MQTVTKRPKVNMKQVQVSKILLSLVGICYSQYETVNTHNNTQYARNQTVDGWMNNGKTTLLFLSLTLDPHAKCQPPRWLPKSGETNRPTQRAIELLMKPKNILQMHCTGLWTSRRFPLISVTVVQYVYCMFTWPHLLIL